MQDTWQRILGNSRISFYSAGAFQSCTRRSPRKIQICNWRNGALLTFWFNELFVQKSTLHRAVYTKSVRESEEMSYNRHSLGRAPFAKYRFWNLHILHFRCFIPCLGSKSLLYCIVLHIRKTLKNRRR